MKELKNKYIQIKVSEKEKKNIQKKANSLGLTVSAYLRMNALKKELEK